MINQNINIYVYEKIYFSYPPPAPKHMKAVWLTVLSLSARKEI